MRTFFKNRNTQKLIANQSNASFNGLSQAKSVLVLFRNETPNKTSLVKRVGKMIALHNLDMNICGYLPFKLEKGAEAVHGYIYENQLNWLGNPKVESVKGLTNQEFDVIIDLDEEMDSPNNFILLSTKAGIRVGVNKKKNLYDLTVERAGNSEESIVNEIEFYLKNIVKA